MGPQGDRARGPHRQPAPPPGHRGGAQRRLDRRPLRDRHRSRQREPRQLYARAALRQASRSRSSARSRPASPTPTAAGDAPGREAGEHPDLRRRSRGADRLRRVPLCREGDAHLHRGGDPRLHGAGAGLRPCTAGLGRLLPGPDRLRGPDRRACRPGPSSGPSPCYERFEAKVAEPLRPVLRKAAEFDPRRRYPDAVALYQALERAFERAEEAPRRRAPRRRRRPRPGTLPPGGAGRGLPARARQGPGSALHAASAATARSARPCASVPGAPRPRTPSSRSRAFRWSVPSARRGCGPSGTAAPGATRAASSANGRKPPPDPEAARRCGRRGCERGAAPLHALLPHLQVEAAEGLERPRASRPLPALPLAHAPRLLSLLSLVRTPRAPRRQLHAPAQRRLPGASP